MADLSDVENAVLNMVDAILEPGGVPVLSYPIKCYRGWPAATNLDDDLRAGISHVSIWEASGYSRKATGYIDGPVDTLGATTIGVSIGGSFGNVITLSGNANASQLAGIKVNGIAYAYACLSTDTPATIAAALAALSAVTPTISGSALTFPNGTRLDARVGSIGTSMTLPRYMTQGVRVMVFAFSPAARDAICSLIDAQIAQNYRFITLSDGQSCQFCYRNTISDDMPQKEQSWRRDLLYTCDYAASITINAPQMLWGVDNITPQSGIEATYYV